MGYQTFPWIKGDSKSYDKLCHLHIPNLKNKTFLDVGCNEGYFCGYAAFANAAKVRGIDRNPQFLAIAKVLFPQCEFVCQDWENLSEEKWDIILNASAIHYAQDQKNFLDLLMSRVKPNGTLILEIGVAKGEENAFVEVKRSIDTRFFPTRAKLMEMLNDYSWKYISTSVPQGGDPVPREVYHISHKLPYAILALDDPHSGKTFTSKEIFKEDIKRIGGDYLYSWVLNGSMSAPEEISRIITDKKYGRDYGKMTWEICHNGLLPRLCEWISQLAAHQSFILDMYIPSSFRHKMAEYLENAGYYVVGIQLQKAISKPRQEEMAPPNFTYKYHKHLQEEFILDEEEYLAANPDVAKALLEGKITSALAHYIFHGRQEGRPRKPVEDKDF